MKIAIVADVPDELAQAWLQHLRDFDAAHPGSHFKILGYTDMSTDDMLRLLDVDPPFAVKRIVSADPTGDE